MRLLNISKDSLRIESDFDDTTIGHPSGVSKAQQALWDAEPSAQPSAVPPYAILSHRWVGDEVVFPDFESVPKSQLQAPPPTNPVPKTPAGAVENVGPGTVASVYKIAGACATVRAEYPEIRHIWIDTVCINKQDGRELSAAINSMFNWYHSATVCYVYLFDVTWNPDDPAGSRAEFLASKWFKRGWTLQELLAPRQVRFYDRDWRYIGTKQKLADDIAQATGISREHLLGDFRTASTAQKMSWLARRSTTMPEDRSYCVLGLFGVFLEARYGRGRDEEFLRLQREIFATGTVGGALLDESLFAWTADAVKSSGLLAPAPGCFSSSGHVVFEPGLAKSREASTRTGPDRVGEPGIRMDAHGNVDFHIPWRVHKHKTAATAAFGVGHLATFGVSTIVLGVGHSVRRRSKDEHLVNLNCWTRGADGQLRTVQLKVVQDKDKTWRRIECGKLFEGEDDHLYSQSDVHGKAGRVTFPHQITFEDDGEMPVQASSGGGVQKKTVKPVKSKAAAARVHEGMEAMAMSPGGWKAPPRRM